MKLYFRYKGRYVASVLLLSLLLLTSGGIAPALAAVNTYNADTNLLLVTPNITLTILSGSNADTLTVAASSFTVTVATGETFTVRSATLAKLNNNGGLNPTCSSSYSELIINGSKTVEVTPDGSGTCTGTTPVPVAVSTPSSGGGGGGGGGGGAPAAPAPVAEAPAATVKTKATPLVGLALGTLLKLPCPAGKLDVNHSCKAVYYYGSDGKRRPFSNEKSFFSWYKDFDGVKTVPLETLAQIPLAKAVTYKPGLKLVKFQTLDKVYAVARDGNLRWITNEGLAKDLYGADWNKKVDDISDAFYVNYKFGSDIRNNTDYSPTAESSSNKSIDQDMGFSD